MKSILSLLALLAIASTCNAMDQPAYDTEMWIGAEYTPSPAGNQLWWAEYEKHEPIVDRELAAAHDIYGFTTMRVFLHSMLFAWNSSYLMHSMDRFLDVAGKHNIRAGFVFLDDCWSDANATIPDSCVPQKGVHNGCWKTSPQAIERTSVDRFQPYVTTIVNKFANDKRVAWWEIFNEPNSSNFSMQLRDSAFHWALAQYPSQPVLACWDDNANTQIVDVHRYSPDFPDWNNDVYQTPTKGALVTEAGSRWFQGTGGDAGSQKLVITWAQALRRAKAAGTVSFVPGLMISWELNVGNSNTRWHWGTPAGYPEPSIPWDANMFPDQTPISWTEAALIRNYTTGVNLFNYVETFMPQVMTNNQDYYLNISSGGTWVASDSALPDSLFEWTFWPQFASSHTVSIHATVNNTNVTSGYQVTVDTTAQVVNVDRILDGERLSIGGVSYKELDCGVPHDGWSIIRVLVDQGTIAVWLNPMHPEAISDNGIQPRLLVKDPMSGTPQGGLLFQSNNGWTAIDYISSTVPHRRLLHSVYGNQIKHASE